MPSELENIVVALRALARDAAQLRPFVRAAADEQLAMLQELQAIGARLPEAQRSMRILDASIEATGKVDPALATIDQIATNFAERVLRAENGPAPTSPGASRAGRADADTAGGSGGERSDQTAGNPSNEEGDDPPVPEWVKELATSLQYPDTDQTVGRLALPNGERIGDQLWSGRIGPGAQLEGLREDLPKKPHLWKAVRQHVEGHAAAVMRRLGGVQHMVLVLSKAPCPYNRPLEERELFKQGCDVALPHILRNGSTLAIYVAERGQPPRFFKTYTGTGRGIKE